MAAKNDPASRKDPLTLFCFSLELKAKGIEVKEGEAFFRGISGLNSESEVVEYKEGGHNTAVRRLPGPAKWPNLVLTNGFIGPPYTLLKWRMALLNDGSGGKFERANGKINALGSDMKTVFTWEFRDAWPVKWSGPQFDATKNELAIETLELAHEGLFVK